MKESIDPEILNIEEKFKVEMNKKTLTISIPIEKIKGIFIKILKLK